MRAVGAHELTWQELADALPAETLDVKPEEIATVPYQFCRQCLATTADYFTDRLYDRPGAWSFAELRIYTWHTCMSHGEIQVGSEWLRAQSAGRHTFTVSVLREYAAEDGEPGCTQVWEPDTIWLSLERAIRRYEALGARGELAELTHDYRMNGEYLYAGDLVAS